MSISASQTYVKYKPMTYMVPIFSFIDCFFRNLSRFSILKNKTRNRFDATNTYSDNRIHIKLMKVCCSNNSPTEHAKTVKLFSKIYEADTVKTANIVVKSIN